MPDHDGLYHQMFDHPEMVAELLREFVPGPWLDDLDLDGMTRENVKYHAATGDRREGDMVWRIPRRDGGDCRKFSVSAATRAFLGLSLTWGKSVTWILRLARSQPAHCLGAGLSRPQSQVGDPCAWCSADLACTNLIPGPPGA